LEVDLSQIRYVLSALEVVLEFVVEWSLAGLSMFTDQVYEDVGISSSVWFVTGEYGYFVLGLCDEYSTI